ncbi:MAG TPA: DUF2790 domain-containing protein [Pseudomonas sp.]|nr:DUF2790 domain-containing protein [Pseudomonas sp.]
MNNKALFLLAMLAAAGAFAAEASAKGDSKANEYAYGMNLDVAEVVSIEEAPHARCEPIDSKLTYRDSKGQVHTVSYVKQDAGCF